MICRLIIDPEHDEEVIIYAHKRSDLTVRIEEFVNENSFEMIGYSDKEGVKFNLCEVIMFTVTDSKLFAILENEKLYLRTRLYVIENELPDNFVKINQSSIVNINYIKRFDTSVAGSLLIRLKGGYSDYVSRRQLKKVKERLNIK